MEIPRRGQRPSMALPEIYVHDSHPSDRYRQSSRSNSIHSIISPSSAMPIPHAREAIPPPLPPPRHIADIAENGSNGTDIAWKWGNSHQELDWGRSVSSVAPGSSLHGSFASRSSFAERPEVARRGSSNATIKPSANGDSRDSITAFPKDEGYASLSGTSIGSNLSRIQDSSLARGFQSSVHDKYRTSAQAYDKSLLQKLDARRGSDNVTPPRSFTKSPFSSSANDTSPTSRITIEHRHPTLKPLSLPIHTGKPALAESPISRWGDTPLSSGISPGNPYPRFTGLGGQYDYRSPTETVESERSPLPYLRRSGSIADDASSIASRSRDGYDQRISPDQDVDFHMEETGIRRLHIDDHYARSEAYSPGSASTGQKRRASSPPRDDGPNLRTVGSASDLFRRRESGSRSSPSPRFHSTSASISSTASGQRSNSYASTLSLAASSITSMNSYGRLSPGGISPAATDNSLDSPYVTSLSSNPSPRGSISSRASHHRTLSETRPLMTSRKMSENLGHVKHNSAPKMQGVYICECCPKKPKKFDSQEELNAHEQEKQYECAYCRNRFKNKNEAERHQNSLHLRRHSWSCAALSGYAAAFHPSLSRPNEADTCGYCGEDFPRSGITSPSPNGPQIAIATDQDWDVRIGHLQEMHKFGECNHAKKFFRADHFRQHLKHSHAGTSGKWTNMLENACMKDEPLPEPIRGPERVSPGGAVRVSRINEEEEIL
ncbi:C2H2 finger domain-containing protein [Rutstroemia sp. NJR-2017a WRK4]|nr:C2H2 finger domain-containing protein [Rutstroemia sp. NJR-2017a WRK4]